MTYHYNVVLECFIYGSFYIPIRAIVALVQDGVMGWTCKVIQGCRAKYAARGFLTFQRR